MGIYTRDQIQYANMLQNALQNRARAIEREGDNLRGRGQMWGSALNTAGNTIKDAAFSIASYEHGDQEAQKQRDFQAEQAALRAKEAMERQAAQEQFQAQQNELNRAYTAEQNALNRKNAMDLAEMNKQDSSEERLLNLERAKKILESKRADLDLDPNNKKLIDAYNEAAWTANKWGSKFEDYTPIEYKSFDNLGRDNATLENWIKAELDKKTPWTDERRDEVFDALGEIGDQKIKDTLIKEIIAKGNTVEETKKSDKAIIGRFNKMSYAEQVQYIGKNPNTAKRLNLKAR